ncbi:unnamed protein product [Lymnaea stagnalis]|uniref:Uncharacterized protein n=1 Tax=Lymnaea stagnalis TaxID=6523 RepID=A0AAV2HV86_LYMST
MIKRFIEQVAFTETPQTYSAVLSVLGFVHSCGLDIKSEASRQLLAIIVSKSGAAKVFAKQLGWQENITRLLTVERRRAFTLTNPFKADSSHAESRSSGGGSVKLLQMDLTYICQHYQSHWTNISLTYLCRHYQSRWTNLSRPL